MKKGFTLIELLVVIAVLGVLAAGVFVAINPLKRINQANDARIKSDVGQISNAMQAYYVTNQKYPSAVSDLVASGDLKVEPKKPDGSPYTITAPDGNPCTDPCTEIIISVPLSAPQTPGGSYTWNSTTGQAGEIIVPTPTAVAPTITPTPTFSPTDLAGLQVWLKADAITGTSDGGTITTWPDSSGNGNNATGNNSPTYKTNMINGKPALQFYGKYLGTRAFVIKQAFMVFRSPPPNFGFSTYGIPLGVLDYAQGRTFIFEAGQTYFHSNPVPLSVWKNGAVIARGSYPIFYNIAPIMDWMILTANTEYPNNSRAYEIGGSEGWLALLDIAEIIGYNNVLSDTDRRKVESYLGAKYGIAVQ